MNSTFYIILITGLLFYTPSYTQQNLVPNPSFEDTLGCPTSPGAAGIGFYMVNDKVKYWYIPNSATTDYYNSCAPVSSGVNVPANWLGYQEAFDGKAYVGVVVYVVEDPFPAEYVQCQLLEPLKPCFKYRVSYQVSLADYSARAIDALGLRLDIIPPKKEQYAPDEFHGFELPPHIAPGYAITDTANWVEVSGYYTAKGGEQYLTIGRFFDTTLYSNENLPPALTNPCDSCFAIVEAYYYIDTVSVIELGVAEACNVIPNVFTPNNDGVNDVYNIIDFGMETMEIYNRWGNKIASLSRNNPVWNGTCKGKPCPSGVYFYIATYAGKTFKGTIQLIR